MKCKCISKYGYEVVKCNGGMPENSWQLFPTSFVTSLQYENNKPPILKRKKTD
jgi:hypothetical protein